MRFFLALFAIAIVSQQAEAKPARCFTSDDGYYNCNFTALDRNGSFSIAAANRPTFSLEMEEPGVAFGSADFGTGRVVPLPGRYLRSSADPACWENDATSTKICAW